MLGEVKQGTLAATAGFVEGEEILSVNDKPTKTWVDAIEMVITNAMDGQLSIKVTVKNATGEQFERVIVLTENEIQSAENLYKNLGFNPWMPKYNPVVAEILPDSAALVAGLKKYDLVVTADGIPITGIEQWIEYVRKRPNVLINLKIERQGAEIVLPITPKSVQVENETEGKIGASMTIPEGIKKNNGS